MIFDSNTSLLTLHVNRFVGGQSQLTVRIPDHIDPCCLAFCSQQSCKCSDPMLIFLLERYQSVRHLVTLRRSLHARWKMDTHTNTAYYSQLPHGVEQRSQPAAADAGDSITFAHNEMKIIQNMHTHSHTQSHAHTHQLTHLHRECISYALHTYRA